MQPHPIIHNRILIWPGVEFHELPGSRIKTRNTHGTGCTLASSIAAELAKGQNMLAAVLVRNLYSIFLQPIWLHINPLTSE